MEENVRNEPAEPPAGASFDFSGSALDLILEHWRPIAAYARDGFLSRGRGTVWIRVGAEGDIAARYEPGSPCECHAELVRDYDPDTEAVVTVVVEGEEDSGNPVYRVKGRPSPVEAVAIVTAEDVGASLH